MTALHLLASKADSLAAAVRLEPELVLAWAILEPVKVIASTAVTHDVLEQPLSCPEDDRQVPRRPVGNGLR
jgi:hypothetical protein